ncbi:MAG TPA: glutaredoxin 3 [Rhodospirillaceae bacterium]|jgi:glutaredoxin 3|nr:glutaredoxin 3 [Alphaproteobacteria bacterium]HBH27007.1 glutaredoxin 3 [Rhodospirillaceae bacterium]
MPEVEIYTWNHCPYCARAKTLLTSYSVPFTEYDITGNDAAREAMVERTGGPRTVPQIFIGGAHIGGCDDLFALDRDGRLGGLLKG